MKTLLETERLILRCISLKDKEEMYQMYTNAAVHKYTGEPLIESMEEMERAIQTRIINYEKYGYGRWATILKDGMQFIGWAGLAYLPEFDEIDIGYRFLPKYWGKGYATEVSQAILTYGFDNLQLERIIAIAMNENKASIRVMEKIGMHFDKYAPYEEGGKDVTWYQIEKQQKKQGIGTISKKS